MIWMADIYPSDFNDLRGADAARAGQKSLPGGQALPGAAAFSAGAC